MEKKIVSAAESISGVMALVSGVAKKDVNTAQKFNFRGIDAVVNAIGPALREVGGLIVPNVIEKHYDRGVTGSGTSTVECFLTIEFAWYGNDGGLPIRGVVAAEARDTSDKATAKAMSVGLRTYLLQTLMLPTDEKDPDSDYIEQVAPKKEPAYNQALTAAVNAAKTLEELQGLWDGNADSSNYRSLFTSKRMELGG